MMKTCMLSVLIVLFGCISSTALAVDIGFVGSEITFSPASPVSGDAMIFTATFRPVGGSVDNFKITGEVDGVQLFERVYAHIGDGVTKTDSFTWTAVTGNHYVRFKLDPDNLTGDSNTANNNGEKSFNVGGGLLPVTAGGGNTTLTKNGYSVEKAGSGPILNPVPDLIISEITVTPEVPNISDTILIKATCRNIGGATAPASHLFFKIGDESNPPVISIVAIPTGGKITVQRAINLGTPNNYVVTVRADEKKEVAESKETNNEKKINFDVVLDKVILSTK